MLTGKLTRLREYREEDLTILTEMLNDEEARSNTIRGVVTPVTKDMVRKHFESGENQEAFHYMMTDNSGRLLGFCEVLNIFKDRLCEITFQIRPQEQGKGYGADALDLLLDMVFLEMNMNKCSATILSFNQAAYSVLIRAGFQKEVVLRDDVYRKGSFHDAFIMGLLKEEYVKGRTASTN